MDADLSHARSNRSINGDPVEIALPRPRPERIVHDGRRLAHGRAARRRQTRSGAPSPAPRRHRQGASLGSPSVRPVPGFEAYRDWVADVASKDDPLFFAIRNKRTGRVEGVASLMEIRPAAGVIEIGQDLPQHRTRRKQGGDRGALPARRPTRWTRCGTGGSSGSATRSMRTRGGRQRAAGFQLRGQSSYQHSVPKGRNRDTAWFSTLDYEWPAIRRNFEAWLSPDNFDANGQPADVARRHEPEHAVTLTNVGILIFDGVEVLDFCGPFEVFARDQAGHGHLPG